MSMKTLKKLLLLVLTLCVLTSAVFAVSAFAEDTAPEGEGTTTDGENTQGTENSLETPYGTIPDEYKDVNEHPIIVFQQDGNDENGNPTYKILSYKMLFGDSGSALVSLRRVEGISYIYLRADQTLHSAYNNIASKVDNQIIVDLNGHTLFHSRHINADPKGGDSDVTSQSHPHSHVVFKNGTFEAQKPADSTLDDQTTKPLISYNIRKYSWMTLEFTFDNITFRFSDDITTMPSYWIATSAEKSTIYTCHNYPLTIKNCTFDIRNVKDSISFFQLGDNAKQDADGNPVYNNNNQVKIIGSNILGTSNLVSWGTVKGIASLTFEKGEDGNYITNTRTDDLNIASEQLPQYRMNYAPQKLTVTLDEKCNGFVKKISERTLENGKTEAVFALEPMDVITPFDQDLVGTKYVNTDAYPIIIFNKDTHKLLWAGNRWGGENKDPEYEMGKDDAGNDVPVQDENGNKILKTNEATGGALQQIRTLMYSNNDINGLYVWIRADFVDSPNERGETLPYYNFGQLRGEHIIDLNGKNFTLSYSFLRLQAKASSALNITVKNGTINVGLYDVLGIGAASKGNATGKISNIVFENVTFDNFAYKKSEQAGHLVFSNNGGTDVIETNVAFNNCTVIVNNILDNGLTYSDPLFILGASSSQTESIENVTFAGGSIQFAGKNIPALYKNKYSQSNKSFAFIYDETNPTVFMVNEEVDVLKSTYPTVTADGSETKEYYLCKMDSKNGVGSYIFSDAGFVGRSLNLESNLNMLYRVFLPTGTTSPKVTFKIGDYETTVEPFKDEGNQVYIFKLAGITPDKIDELIYITLVDGDVEYESQNRIVTYLNQLTQYYPNDTSMMALVDSLLTYSAAAKKYVDPDAQVDKDLTGLGEIGEEWKGISSDNNGLNYYALNLDGAFALRVGIQLAGKDKSSVTLKVTKGGETTEHSLSGYIEQTGLIVFTYKNITALELGTDVTFALYENGASDPFSTLTISANNYLYGQQNSQNVNLSTLVKAIFAYGKAAEVYKAAHTK